MLVPGHPDLQQLALVVFFIPATSANTLPTLVVVTLCNLHCVVMVVVVYIYSASYIYIYIYIYFYIRTHI